MPTDNGLTPLVHVLRGGLKRMVAGRGFSVSELKEAHLSVFEARKLGITVDPKRRTMHQHNVTKLGEWVAKIKLDQHVKPQSRGRNSQKISQTRSGAFRGLTLSGKRVRGLLASRGLRSTHIYKWRRKQRS